MMLELNVVVGAVMDKAQIGTQRSGETWLKHVKSWVEQAQKERVSA